MGLCQEKERFLRRFLKAVVMVKEIESVTQQEYITLEEALEITGLAEKTLRAKLRGRVPIIGHNSWFREAFFNFWQEEFSGKMKQNRIETVNKVRNLGKSLASKTRRSIIKTAPRKSEDRS